MCVCVCVKNCCLMLFVYACCVYVCVCENLAVCNFFYGNKNFGAKIVLFVNGCCVCENLLCV